MSFDAIIRKNIGKMEVFMLRKIYTLSLLAITGAMLMVSVVRVKGL